jgi:hypothetical protein
VDKNAVTIPVLDFSWNESSEADPLRCVEHNASRPHWHWLMCTDKTKVYVSEEASNKRYTAEEARKCLSGHSLMFMGDSLTRYQYMSLAQFIHTGMFPNGSQRVEPDVLSRNVCIEDTFNGWQDYLLSTNKMLSTPENVQNYEICDCYRPPVTNASLICDNRFYKNHDVNLSLNFISALGRDPTIYGSTPQGTHPRSLTGPGP